MSNFAFPSLYIRVKRAHLKLCERKSQDFIFSKLRDCVESCRLTPKILLREPRRLLSQGGVRDRRVPLWWLLGEVMPLLKGVSLQVWKWGDPRRARAIPISSRS